MADHGSTKNCVVTAKSRGAAEPAQLLLWEMNAAHPHGPSANAAPPIAIIGAGIAGLSAAWHLQQAGASVVLFEASGRAGGAIASIRRDGWLHEAGPNSILEGAPEVEELITALNLSGRRIYAAPAARNRYVIRSGHLEAAPTSPLGFCRTHLFSSRAKWRVASEIFRPRGDRSESETVAEFTQRRWGKEFLDYAIDPMVGGIYAGDPTRLSIRHAFPKLLKLERQDRSLLLGAVRRRNTSGGPTGRIFSFVNGLRELPDALAGTLGDSLRLNALILSVTPNRGRWEIVSQQQQPVKESFSHVICTLPPDALAALKFGDGASLARLVEMREVEQPPVASVFLGYRRSDVDHPLDGFGMLAPRIECRHILGCLFSSTLFPGRAPAGYVGITAFVGGARQPVLGRLEEPDLVEWVHSELSQLLGIHARPVWTSIRRHSRSIPQYTVEYDRFKNICAEAERSAPGLLIGGKGRDGISLPACLASGKRLAWAALGRPHFGS